MRKEQLQAYLLIRQAHLEEWQIRLEHSMWNDDGKGNHIKAEPMIIRYQAQVDLLNELISKCD